MLALIVSILLSRDSGGLSGVEVEVIGVILSTFSVWGAEEM